MEKRLTSLDDTNPRASGVSGKRRSSPERHHSGVLWQAPQRELTAAESLELTAQVVACEVLTKVCERALFDFGLSSAATPSPEAIDVRVADIVHDILASWRDTHHILKRQQLEHGQSAGFARRWWLTEGPASGQDTRFVSRAASEAAGS